VPTLIKRPILNTSDQWLVGFSSDLYQTLVWAKPLHF
jgi:arsenate reductase-like glutaredoxin family protein